MKKIFLIPVLAIVASVVSAQNLGVDYYLLGDYVAAKQYFEQNTSANAAQSNFYLGEIAFKEGNAAAAKSYYEKGLAANPADLYNQIGLLKLQIKGGDAKSLDKQFKAIQKLAKKDVDVVIAVSRAYLDNGDNATAMLKLEAVKKINKKSPQASILEGDIIRTGGNEKLGDAAGKYEMSNLYDANFPLGYVKSAQIYESLNPYLAVELLKKDTELNPDYLIAFRELGKVYVERGNYPLAIEAYTKFFTGNTYTNADVEKLARAYYFSDQYAHARQWVDKGLAADPSDYVLNRLNMYIDAKESKTENGLKAANKFFAIPYATPHLPLDYEIYAELLAAAGQYQQAFAAYNEGIAVDSMKFENLNTRKIVAQQHTTIMQKAADAARKHRDFGLAAEYYEQYMQATGANEAKDITALWQNYYSAGTLSVKDSTLLAEFKSNSKLIDKAISAADKAAVLADPTNALLSTKLKAYYLAQADLYADKIVEKYPGFTGYRLKALTHQAMSDKILSSDIVMEGAAKPYYEQMIEKINPDAEEVSASGKQALLEAYVYLGYYYYLVNDKTNAIIYCQKVIEIDPNNANAKIILEAYEKQGK